MNIAYRAASTDRRLSLLLTALVHLALIAGWYAARTLPAPAPPNDGPRSRVLWIPLPRSRPALRDSEPAPPPKESTARPIPLHPRPAAPLALPPAPAIESRPTPAPAAAPAPAQTPAPATATATQPAPPGPSAEQILERARRDIGGIDKALRKENKPYIAAPLDSPQMRLRQGIEHARAMAPNRIWEAPKVEELVNNTGDGARRSRVVGGRGTYCVTERATNTDVEMIEHHGKLRITSCPTHEEPAKKQEWRTLQD
ncbi:hypothetical protein [Massilia sp. WG5]|uniref:hypothetical protein n=1 Tax=Massilia sp. WG5 TaxID=1707785 RepID=UPI000706113A|nr:hypothetical protein [Massilia sp. WG5]ALK98133.1 hypothetical protein AM586_20035 [Massilia sp. WG5]